MSIETKHTPGPWKVYDEGRETMHIGSISEIPGQGWRYDNICQMFEDEADNYDTHNEFVLFPNAKANARLIAAAPELLKALCDMMNTLTDGPDESDIQRVWSQARAAIAKATGGEV